MRAEDHTVNAMLNLTDKVCVKCSAQWDCHSTAHWECLRGQVSHYSQWTGNMTYLPAITRIKCGHTNTILASDWSTPVT